MNAWADNFLWWVALMGLLAWIVPNLFWGWKGQFYVKVFICLLGAVMTLVVVGASLSVIVHISEIGRGQVAQSAITDPLGAVAYFSETGMETGAIWVPVLLIKLLVLSLRYSRATK